jgi:hypothetical protein
MITKEDLRKILLNNKFKVGDIVDFKWNDSRAWLKGIITGYNYEFNFKSYNIVELDKDGFWEYCGEYCGVDEENIRLDKIYERKEKLKKFK